MKDKGLIFFEIIGSIVQLLFDPVRWDNKKYLNPKYSKSNKIVGIITTVVIIGIVIYFIIN